MRNLLLVLMILVMSCTKAATTHSLRIITFAVDRSGNYVEPTNTAMYLNKVNCICFPDSIYGYNTNPTFELDGVGQGDILHIISFNNAGESVQYKSIRIYLDNQVIYNVYNVEKIDDCIEIK